MIPFVKLYARQFHVTPKTFLRKIVPRTSSIDLKSEFPESNFDSSSSFQSSCPDYLGIESDENVITVQPQKHRLQQPQTGDNREKFYYTSFGIVRFDEDNKPKYHGQFKRTADLAFPHSSSKSAKVSSMSEISCRIPYQHLPSKDSAAAALNNKINRPMLSEESNLHSNYIDDCYFGTYDTENTTQQPPSEELSNLEKDASKYVKAKNIVDSANYSKNKIEELNYIDKDYFEISTNSENLYPEPNTTDDAKSNKDDSSLVDNNQSEELNYLEKDYFGALDNSQSLSLKSAFDKEDQNNFSKGNNFSLDVEELSFLEKSFYEGCSSNNLKKSIHYKDSLKSSSHFEEINDIINKEFSNKHWERNQDSEIKIKNEVSNNVFTGDNSHNLTEKQTSEINLKKTVSSKTKKCDVISDKNIQTAAKNANLPKKLFYGNEPVESSSVENSLKISKIVSEEPDLNNEISTAHDFVKKLREEQKIPVQISKSGKRKNEEKFDSKGFRILKNQVPDFSHFTREEILNILKQNIVYSDDNLLILNKPYSLVMHESETTKKPCLSSFLDDLAKEMDKQSTNPQLFTVHRLDKETTGCLLLARNEIMAMHLKALFAQRKIIKKYWIITSGVPDPPEGIIDIPISEGSINNRKRMVLHPKLPKDIVYHNHSKNGIPAITTYRVISESGNAALVEVFPKTGVKHQIRVHFGFGLGCPVLGDHKYAHLDKLAPQKLPSDMLQRLHVRQSKVRHIPMHIHAKSVAIPDYFDKRELFVNIPIPDYFKLNLKRLKFKKKNMIS